MRAKKKARLENQSRLFYLGESIPKPLLTMQEGTNQITQGESQ